MDWFDSSALGISVDSNDVYFIHTPEEFYSTLQNKIRNAKHRIYLSSLYMGTGSLEHALVDEIGKALSQNTNLRAYVLFDYLRGTRGGKESTLELFGQKRLTGLDAYFFHTPDLRGYLKQYLPERVNEIVGLQHMKFYIFDNSIILSGANLSDSYFTNRQDRYVVIENCPKLIEFFVSVFDAVSSCSVKLIEDGNLKILPAINEFPFHGDVETFCNKLRENINVALTKLDKLQSDFYNIDNTVVYPFLQMGPFGIRQEEKIMDDLLTHKNDDIRVCFSTGYFNFHDTYADTMLKNSGFPISVLLASPQANGFYGATGVSGSIPALYVYLSMIFYQKIQSIGKAISLFEYTRPGWTFHAKGTWIEPTKDNSWAATIVGSSNYGYRSTFRDLEAQVLIVTSNRSLISRIKDEKKHIMEYMTKIEMSTFQRPDHLVPMWVRNKRYMTLICSVSSVLFVWTMPIVFSTGLGLLAREFYKRMKPNNSRIPAPALTRGLYTTSKREVIHRKRYCPKDPFNYDELKQRLGGYSVRRYCSSANIDDWVPVYRFPGIRIYSLISRAKFLQTVASILFVPYQLYQYSNEQISTNVFVTSLVFAAIAPLVLIMFTRYFNRMIGVVAFSDKTQLVRFGYLGFWGGRTNIIVPLNDVVPLTDTIDIASVKPITRLDLKQHGFLLMSLRKCEIVDEGLAEEIFGNLKYFHKFEESDKHPN